MAYTKLPVTNGVTEYDAARDQYIQDGIVAAAATADAVNAELGTNPSGPAATVAARLDGIEADVDALGSGSIPDGSVSTAKLANGAVTAAKVAADVATQAELDAAIAALPGTYAQKSATWATGVDYVVDELVINSGTSASTTAHTSGASFDAGNFTAIAT